MTFSFTIPMWIMYILGGAGALILVALVILGIAFIVFMSQFKGWA